jgi:GMP synthase (glutamine-hydrolysing)
MQLLGRFAGGRIDHAAEAEIGELEVEVVEHDGLLRDVGERPRVFQYHTDELIDLPAGFRLLATTARCRVQAIASEQRGWWGTQFHPESYRSANPDGERILRRFFELAAER